MIKRKSYDEKKEELRQQKLELAKKKELANLDKELRTMRQEIQQNNREEFLNSRIGKTLVSIKNKLNQKRNSQKLNQQQDIKPKDTGIDYMKRFKL